VDAVRSIELRAIFSGVEVGPDAEVALRDSFDLDRERLRLPALPLGRPFRCDLCADNQDRYAEQQRVLEPPWFELEADELSNSDVEQFVEAKAEHAEGEQCRRSTEDFSRQETADRVDVLFVQFKQLWRNGRRGRSVAHRSLPLNWGYPSGRAGFPEGSDLGSSSSASETLVLNIGGYQKNREISAHYAIVWVEEKDLIEEER
jgi:hypothetical protein